MRTLFLAVLFIVAIARLCNAADVSVKNDAPIVNEVTSLSESNTTPMPNTTPTALPNIYKWVDDDGLTHYGDKPPSESITPLNLPDVQIIKNLDAEQIESSTPEATPNQSTDTSKYRLNISAPKNSESVMQNNDGTVAIALSINMPLLENHHIFINADGNKVATDNSGTINLPLTQGSHTVQAIIMDDSQAELASSDTITFMVISHNQRIIQPRATVLPTLAPTASPTSAPTLPAPKPTKAPKPPKITPKPVPYING